MGCGPSSLTRRHERQREQQREREQSAALEWVKAYHDASGSLDMKHWLDTMFTTTPNPSIKFFEFPLLEGRPTIEAVFTPFVAQLDYLHHEVGLTEYVAPHIYHRCTVSYLPKGGDKLTDMIVADVFVLFTVQPVAHEKDGRLWFRCERMEAFGDPSELLKKVQVG